MAFRTPPSFVPELFLSNVDPALDQFWHPVAPVTELPANGAPLRIELLGKSWVLVTLGQFILLYWLIR